MVRTLAILFGIAFIFVGVAGGGAFSPRFIDHGLLFNYFTTDISHNLVYLVTGIIALIAATNQVFSKFFFILFGVIYALMGIIGISKAGDIYFMHNNMSDNYLYLAIAFVLLIIGLTARGH